jgi:hypothetical protein
VRCGAHSGEKVERDHAPAGGQRGGDEAPDLLRRAQAVDEHERVALTNLVDGDEGAPLAGAYAG